MRIRRNEEISEIMYYFYIIIYYGVCWEAWSDGATNACGLKFEETRRKRKCTEKSTFIGHSTAKLECFDFWQRNGTHAAAENNLI